MSSELKNQRLNYNIGGDEDGQGSGVDVEKLNISVTSQE